jgi:hypothetical protein
MCEGAKCAGELPRGTYWLETGSLHGCPASGAGEHT